MHMLTPRWYGTHETADVIIHGVCVCVCVQNYISFI